MRKDVKLGFAIGGVLLAVLIVYVLVVPGGGDKRLSQATGNGDASSQSADAGKGVTLEPIVPPPVPPPVTPSTTESGGGSTAVAQAQGGQQSPPPAPPVKFDPPPAGGTDPFEQPKDEPVAAANSKSSNVDWSKLLNDSQVLMVPEPTPAGGKPAAVTPVSASTEKAESTVATGNVPDVTKPGPTPIDSPPAEPAQAKND